MEFQNLVVERKETLLRCMLLSGCMLFLVSACERPFIEPNVPEIEIISPEINRIFFNPTVVIRARATSFREVEFMELFDERMHFDESVGSWIDTLVLEPGLNTVRIKAIDIGGTEGEEEFLFAHLIPRYEDNAPRLPAPVRLGGHTATLLEDGSVLVTGGAARRTGQAFASAYLLERSGSIFTRLDSNMKTGRMGHTASLLPDGRVLIMGGGISAEPDNVSEFAQNALIFDPPSRSFIEVPFVDSEFAPDFQRSGHITFVTESNGRVFVDVYGGDGPLSEGGIGQLDDIQSYRLVGDSLVYVDVVRGLEDFPPAVHLSNTVLNPEQELGQFRYLVSGVSFSEGLLKPVNKIMDFSSGSAEFPNLPFRFDRLPSLLTSRFRHTSTLMEEELVFILGGAPGTNNNSVIGAAEVYFDHTQTFFTLENRISSVPRQSHTATKLPSGRILIIGGFNRLGDAIPDSQYFTWR